MLRKPEIVIEKGDQDRLNWELGEAPPAAAAAKQVVEPDNRFDTPLIGRLEVTDGKLSYRDPKRKLDLDGTVSTATGRAGDQPQAELQLKGKLEGQPLVARFVGGSIVMLRDTEQPYPSDLDVTFGATKLKAKGTVMDPFQWTGATSSSRCRGTTSPTSIRCSASPARRLRPTTSAASCIASPASGNSPRASGMSATATSPARYWSTRRRKPGHLTAKLVSQKLVFADLAPLVGAPPDKPGGNVSPQQRQTQKQLEATGDLFPNVPLKVEKLRAMNMDVTLDAKRVHRRPATCRCRPCPSGSWCRTAWRRPSRSP